MCKENMKLSAPFITACGLHKGKGNSLIVAVGFCSFTTVTTSSDLGLCLCCVSIWHCSNCFIAIVFYNSRRWIPLRTLNTHNNPHSHPMEPSQNNKEQVPSQPEDPEKKKKKEEKVSPSSPSSKILSCTFNCFSSQSLWFLVFFMHFCAQLIISALKLVSFVEFLSLLLNKLGFAEMGF